jgi:hypothetical protein
MFMNGMLELGMLRELLVPEGVGRDVDDGPKLMVIGAMVDVEKEVSDRTMGRRWWLLGLGAARTLISRSVERRVIVYILK